MRLKRPLGALLEGRAPHAGSVGNARAEAAFGRGGPLSIQQILDAATALVAGTAAEASGSTGQACPRWLVETEDAGRVAVTLLAAIRSGARLVLPPNLQPGTLAALRADCSQVLAGPDAVAPKGIASVDPLATDADNRAAPGQSRDNRLRPLVDLFTSGSSGPGKVVTKALAHLEDEVVELERLLGDDLAPDAAVLATVPCHHLYGLLFRLLWPLASGRPLCRDSFLLPDDLLGQAAAHDHVVVVSSPAHLRHLAASPRLREHAGRIQAVFSSGGPLDTATALAVEKALGAAPVEIFGSTETGGVASRRATGAEPSPRWTTFAPVRVERRDGRLHVSSPFVTRPGEVPDTDLAQDVGWTMGDLVRIDDGGFRLLGRSDRVAKVGEKTLALPDIERKLAGHEAVESAVVGTYQGPGGARLGAVVVLTDAGRLRVATDGRRALQSELAALVAADWDRVAVPRRWRFRDQPVADARGKFPQAAFEAELERPLRDPVGPLVTGERRDGDETVVELVVPRDLAFLSGHYESFPLVPGAVQLGWVLEAAGRRLGRAAAARTMDSVKFRSVLRPGQALSMHLVLDGDGRLSFALRDGDTVFSSGRMTLAD